jgi:tRNA threonylcarbamoyladenosine biosynthesis protein TsaE
MDFITIAYDHVHVVAMSGELGSGKTTFVQGVLRACGAEGPFTSPTFTIIKIYDVHFHHIQKIYHIDAYRIDSDDIMDIGWQDILDDPHALILVEWPEMITKVLPNDVVTIYCKWINDTQRQYTFSNL